MNPVDAWVFSVFSHIPHHSTVIDGFTYVVMDSRLLKGGMLMSVLWWLWFAKSDQQTKIRQIVLVSLLASFVSVALAKGLERAVPFRVRPVNNPLVSAIFTYSAGSKQIEDWLHSSFPSDHAALFLTIAFALFFVSRRVGMGVLLYVLAVIAFPRVYNGIHYATDILAGGGIALCSAMVFNIRPVRERLTTSVVAFAELKPVLFYPLFFMICFEVTDLFEDVRAFGSFFFRML